jgi:PAS domain-containing protein
MSNQRATYQELLDKVEQLQAKNKQLRLRPAVHSADARLISFMKTKSQLANAMLHAQNIKEAIRISVQYLSKIDNIHGLAFFKNNTASYSFEILQEHKIPKRLLNYISNSDSRETTSHILFPQQTLFFTNYNGSNRNDSVFLTHLKSYHSVLILPIVEDSETKYSLLLISKKTFRNSRLFKIVYENIQAQLKSSYSRILSYQNKAKEEKTDLHPLEDSENYYANINKELVRQIKVYREQNIKLGEDLVLYKSIIQQQKDIIVRLNKDGQILFHNPAFNQINIQNGSDKENILCYFGEGDFPGFNQILFDFEEGIQQVNCEIQLFDDGPKWYNVYFSPIRNKRDLIVEIQIVARNIDQIIKLEQKLELQKEMLMNMLKESNFLGLSIDQQGFINMVSHNFEHKTKIKESHILHHCLLDLVDANSKNKIENYLNNRGKSSSLNTQIRFKGITTAHQYFTLNIHPINQVSVQNQYFIANLSAIK